MLLVEERYEEALKIMEDIACDIEHAIGGVGTLGVGFVFQQQYRWGGPRKRVDFLREQSELYSADWLQKAAEMGYFQPSCLLGLHHLVGKGVEKDVPKAISLLEASAKLAARHDGRQLFDGAALCYIAHSTPDYVLGCIFSSDEFVETDYTKAFAHYNRATKSGYYYALLGALWILEGADGVLPIDIDAAECLCADLLVDEVVRTVPSSFQHVSHGPSPRNFLLQKLEDYAKIARYKLQGEVLPLARWSQKTGIPQQVLEERIQRGLSDAEVLRPLDETEKAECDKSGVPSVGTVAGPARSL